MRPVSTCDLNDADMSRIGIGHRRRIVASPRSRGRAVPLQAKRPDRDRRCARSARASARSSVHCPSTLRSTTPVTMRNSRGLLSFSMAAAIVSTRSRALPPHEIKRAAAGGGAARAAAAHAIRRDIGIAELDAHRTRHRRRARRPRPARVRSHSPAPSPIRPTEALTAPDGSMRTQAASWPEPGMPAAL